MLDECNGRWESNTSYPLTQAHNGASEPSNTENMNLP